MHVRQLIPFVDFEKTKALGIIPEISWTKTSKNYSMKKIKYPVWVLKNKSFCAYGMFIDFLCKKMLSQENWKDSVWDSAKSAYAIYPEYPTPILSDINQKFGYYVNLNKFLHEIFTNCTIQVDSEYNFDVITSHPDIIVFNNDGTVMVLDIKTTINFENMEKETILQILSYYSVLKALGVGVTTIGVVLSLQCCLLTFDMTKIDFSHEKFLKILIGTPQPITKEHLSFVLSLLMPQLDGSFISQKSQQFVYGHHISKGKGIAQSLQYFTLHTCSKFCQMFLRSPVSSTNPTLTNSDLDLAKQIIRNKNIQYFTHASYLVNLCDPSTKLSRLDKNPYKFCLSIVRKDLRLTKRLEGHGVVIHTGKQKEMSIKDATNNMVKFTKKILREATPYCPLLIETGAGRKGEMFCDANSFYEFLRGKDYFTIEESKKLYCCVDSCHVWASGYNPLQYLQDLERMCPGIVKLVHFNNCKLEKGCRKDLHARVESGKIPENEMWAVFEWCRHRNIPLLQE